MDRTTPFCLLVNLAVNGSRFTLEVCKKMPKIAHMPPHGATRERTGSNRRFNDSTKEAESKNMLIHFAEYWNVHKRHRSSKRPPIEPFV